MALIKSDRVKETSTSTGNGTFSLAGAATGYRTFASVCVVGDTFFYGISNQTSGEWETGLGTYSATNTLTRTTVHASSNSGAIVTFGAGNKEVFLTASARYLERIVDNELFTSVGSSTSVVAVNDGPQPQLDLAFSADKTLTARYGPTPSFSRASTGTVTNSSGVLTSAAVNEPRFDHVLENGVWVSKGLLIEEQRTNLCLQSNVTNTTWTSYRATCTTNSISSPDGTINASLIVEGSFNDVHYHRQNLSISSGTYTVSVYAKAKERYIVSFGGAATGRKYFNLQTGTVGSTAFGSPASTSITPVGNGWYRLSVTGPSYAGGLGEHIQLILANNIENETYSGDGTSGAYFWGAQVEAGSFPTSYIPTVATSVVRSADVCQITGGDFSGFYNQSVGSIAIEYDMATTALGSAIQRPLTVWNSGYTSGIVLDNRSAGTTIELGTNAGVDFGSVVSPSSIAMAYKINDFAASRNGAAVLTDTSGTVVSSPILMNIGNNVSSLFHNGHIARLRYFNTRLANQTLVQLSGGINNLVYKSITGSGNATVTNGYTNINVSVPNPLPVANGGTGGTTAVSGAVNLIKSAPNDGAEYTLKSKQISGTPSFYWVDSTGYAPTLDLLFAADKSLTAYTGPTPSYSRASTGTYFNASGVLTTAAINAPRFNHVYNGSSWVSKGLLIEEQRTNIILQSQDASNVSWTKLAVTTTPNSGIFVDGTQTAALITASILDTNRHLIYQTVTAAAGTYSFSTFIKKTNNRYAAVGINDNGIRRYGVNFDFDTGAVTHTDSQGTPTGTGYTIINCGSGWYRITVTMTSTGTNITGNVGLSNSATPTWSFSMPQFLNTGTESMLAAGFQMELGAFPTSYIPTTTAAVTRSADVCQITGTDFSGFYNQSEGSFAVEFDVISENEYQSSLYLAHQSGSSWIGQRRSTGLGIYFDVYNSNVQQARLTATMPTAGTLFRSAGCYKSNDFACSFNGAAVLTDAVGSLPSPTSLAIGNFPAYGEYHNGHIARLRYYPVRIPNATLQVLST
jgi:hypothetical protein